jgi:hypothetical protein
MIIQRSIDIEDVVRQALSDYLTAYCRPLPDNFLLPSILVQQVAGTDSASIDTFEVVLDSRADNEAEALETLRNAIGILKAVSKQQTTPIRFVSVNSSGSWGNDPMRPELAMCSARLSVVAHEESTEVSRK